jgi:hypothetical protein
MMTREELAAMTDEQILAHYRHKHGDPYMPLSMAKKMQHEERKWRHATALAKKRSQEGKLPAPEPCRYGDGTCLTHGIRRVGHSAEPL